MTGFDESLELARGLDREDPLGDFRSRFFINEGQIYMDGNSLGLCSADAERSVLNMLRLWKEQTINIWGTQGGKYLNYSEHLARKTAFLIGAQPEEIAIVGSTTVNIHQAIATFYQPTKTRYKILVDDLNFPTDRYAIDSQIRLKGLVPEDVLKLVNSPDGVLLDENRLIEAMTEEVALILLPSVLYRSAQLLDMERITAAARKRGILIGWDLCHSIGAVPHDFEKIGPDFAVWCTYKYLAAGPGANAGIYINSRHFGRPAGLAGWFGNRDETQFRLDHVFDQDPTAKGWQIGTPSLLSMAPIEGVLDIYAEAGMERIREKSLKITSYLMDRIDGKLSKYGFGIGNPREDQRRGGHVCLTHPDAYRISSAMKDHGIIPDFREPDVIRLAPVALYVSYLDVWEMVERIGQIMEKKAYERYSDKRSLVV